MQCSFAFQVLTAQSPTFSPSTVLRGPESSKHLHGFASSLCTGSRKPFLVLSTDSLIFFHQLWSFISAVKVEGVSLSCFFRRFHIYIINYLHEILHDWVLTESKAERASIWNMKTGSTRFHSRQQLTSRLHALAINWSENCTYKRYAEKYKVLTMSDVLPWNTLSNEKEPGELPHWATSQFYLHILHDFREELKISTFYLHQTVLSFKVKHWR